MSGHIQNVKVCNQFDKELNTYCYKAIANGNGYSIGDLVEFKQIINVDYPMNPTFMIWFNVSTINNIFVYDEITSSNNTGTFPPISDFIPCSNIPNNILEKEVCATINGIQYQINRIYTRNIFTGDITILKYEFNDGTVVTGSITEECCNCNSECEAPTLLFTDVSYRCTSYGAIGGSSFTGKLLDIDWGNDTYGYYNITSFPAGTVPVIINGSSGVIWSGNINISGSIYNLVNGLNANDPTVNYSTGEYWKIDDNVGIRNNTLHTSLVINGVTYNLTVASGNTWPCTNHFPVDCYTEIAVTTNNGGSWNIVKPKGLGFTINTVGDVLIRDDGFGLGFANLIDNINPYIIPYGMQLKTISNNGWVTEYQTGVNATDVNFKVLYYFIPQTDGNCNPDPVDYQYYFSAINLMTAKGDNVFINGADSSNFAALDITIVAESPNADCQNV